MSARAEGGLLEIIKSDHERIATGNSSLVSIAMTYLRKRHFRPIVSYRICRWIKKNPSFISRIFYPFFRIIHRFNCGALCMELPVNCEIGEGLRVFHGYGLVVNDGVKIGRSVTLMHHVTIGSNGKGVPVIGDGVEIGTHSVVIGPIRLGERCVIGAGVVIVKDVPAQSIVVGEKPRYLNEKKRY